METLILDLSERIKEFYQGILFSLIVNPANCYLVASIEDPGFNLIRKGFGKGYEDYETMLQFFKDNGIDVSKFSLNDSNYTFDENILKYKIDHYLNLTTGRDFFKTVNQLITEFDYSSDFNEAAHKLKILVDNLEFRSEGDQVNLGQNYSEVVERLFLEMRSDKSTAFFTQSFPTFNRITQGLKLQNVIVVAGAYKQGKTSFGTQLLLDYGSKGIPVGIINLEMSKEEIEDRIIGIKTKTELGLIRNPKKLNENQLAEMSREYSRAMVGKKIFLESSTLDESGLETVIRDWVNLHGVKIVLIDYISLIIPTNKTAKREEIVSGYSRLIKNIAKKYNVVVIVLAQLNRAGLDNPDSSNMAESIALSRDADFIFTISNPFNRGVKSGRIGESTMCFEANDFLVKLTESRHTSSNQMFLIRMLSHGEMVEVKTNEENYDR